MSGQQAQLQSLCFNTPTDRVCVIVTPIGLNTTASLRPPIAPPTTIVPRPTPSEPTFSTQVEPDDGDQINTQGILDTLGGAISTAFNPSFSSRLLATTLLS